MKLPTSAGALTAAASSARVASGRYEPAVADRDLPRTGTVDSLTRRRWVTIVPRAALLLTLIGSLTALAVGVVVVVVALVLAATAG